MTKSETVRAAAGVPEQATTTTGRLPKLPKLPTAARKPKPQVECACGCGSMTKGTWFPGHDATHNGLVLRIVRGVMSEEQVVALVGEAIGRRAIVAAASGAGE